MTITKITVTGLNKNNMGDASEADAAGYREWLGKQLASEFPEAEIDLIEQDATRGLSVETDGDDANYSEYEGARDQVANFLEECWNRCNWEWVA